LFFNLSGVFMLVACPSCSKQLNVPDSAAGKKAKCPVCTKVFDIPGGVAVAVAPAPKAPPPAPPRRDRIEDEDRPRRRPREDEEDDDDRPRGKRGRDRDRDEDIDAPRGRPDDREDDDDRPSRRRGAGGGVQAMAGSVAMWLKLSGFMLIVYFVVSLVNTYFTTAAAFRLVFGNGPMPPGVSSPMAPTLIWLVVGLVILGPCLTFIFLGASRAAATRGRGMVMAGLIIAIVLGSLIGIGAIFGLIGLFTIILTFMQPIFLVVAIATCVITLLGGIKGLSIMSQPALKEAFGVNISSRRGRGRDRDDRDDDYDDDDRDERPRRRRRDEDD
jgi:ribosomal protein S27E